LTRTLATVLAGGTPLVEALEIARGAVSNRFVSRGLVSAVNEIREGSTLAAAIERPQILPKLAIEMLSVGEETGSLEPMLRDVAEFYEGDLDVRLSQLTTWIEPGAIAGDGTPGRRDRHHYVFADFSDGRDDSIIRRYGGCL
jgi:type IV pilus assembly protein PilC